MKHPMQRVEIVDGVERFVPNRIVEFLARGRLDELASLPFEDADREQLYQLLGYRLDWFADLSYTSNEACKQAYEEAERLKEGCRDTPQHLHWCIVIMENPDVNSIHRALTLVYPGVGFDVYTTDETWVHIVWFDGPSVSDVQKVAKASGKAMPKPSPEARLYQCHQCRKQWVDIDPAGLWCPECVAEVNGEQPSLLYEATRKATMETTAAQEPYACTECVWSGPGRECAQWGVGCLGCPVCGSVCRRQVPMGTGVVVGWAGEAVPSTPAPRRRMAACRVCGLMCGGYMAMLPCPRCHPQHSTMVQVVQVAWSPVWVGGKWQ